MAISIFTDRKFVLFIQIWWVLVMIMQFIILREIEVDYYHAAVDAIASSVTLGFLSFMLSNNMRFYLPRKEKYWYILISGLIVCIFWMILLLIIFKIIFPADDPYINFFQDTAWIRYGYRILTDQQSDMFSLLIYNQQEQRNSKPGTPKQKNLPEMQNYLS